MRKAPLINISFGVLNILEAAQKFYSGDLEAAIHSLYAVGYNFTSGFVSYLPGLANRKNLDKSYVNGFNGLLNFFGSVIDYFHKHTAVSGVDTWKTYEARLYSRSISFSFLLLQQMITETADVCELWTRSKDDK